VSYASCSAKKVFGLGGVAGMGEGRVASFRATRWRFEEDPMRKLIVSEFITLDGVIQSPGYPSGGFEAGGWQQRYFDDAFGRALIDGLAASGGLLLGRKTYEIFAGHWPKQPADDPLAPIINGLPKYVASTTLQEPLPWANSHLLQGDVAQAVGELKAQDGKDLRVLGSGELVQTLMEQDLVDEYAL
jgi:dihydrofolate reductase